MPNERVLSDFKELKENQPALNISELVVQLMSDAEVELALRQVNHPTTLMGVATNDGQASNPTQPAPR